MSNVRALTAIGLTAIGLITTVACGGGGGGGGGTATAPPPPSVAVVEIFDNRFEPKRLSIDPGTTVRWIHRGNVNNHTTTEMALTWDSGMVFINAGDTYERTFTAADDGRTFEYSCVSHKACCEMQGSVRVGASAPAPSPGY